MFGCVVLDLVFWY